MNHFESQCLAIKQANESFLLHPHRVMYWPAQSVLFVADVHVGKEHVFGRNGIPIPGGISERTLQQLFALAHSSGAKRLIVLGDFMHNVPLHSESWLTYLSQLLDEQPDLTVDIVAGNHDRVAGRHLIDSRICWHAEGIVLGGLVLRHEPKDDTRGYVLSGHIHPAWRIGSVRRGGIRAPIFWFREGHMVMPAFGEFTGGMLIEPDSKHDKLYMIGPDTVVQVPANVKPRSRWRIN